MNITIFMQSLSGLRRENLRITNHFEIRHEERKDDVMPDIDGIYELLRSGDAVSVTNQEEDKFVILFNLNENYDLVMAVGVDDTNPEIILRLITCYKQERSRRVK